MTKTKAVIAFLLSLSFSLILSPAFDKVARLFFYRSKEASQSSGPQAGPVAPVGSDSTTSGSGEEQSNDAVQRLKRITEQGRAAGKKAP